MILLNPILMQTVTGSVPKTTMTLLFLLEGSLGLIGGSIVALSSTPSITKVAEIALGTDSWSMEGEKNAERVAVKWIICSAIIVLAGFVVSAI